MSYNPYTLEHKTVLVTGAASGIGRATAVECALLGATLFLTDLNEEGLQETLQLLDGKERGHQSFAADLCDETALVQLVAALPPLDGCVNNAGVGKLIPAPYITAAEIERMHKINLWAPMLLVKNLLAKRKLKNPSSVVFTASAAGVYRVSPGNGVYAAAKCGIDAFMRTTALELAPRGIRCNSVNPGMVVSNFMGQGTYTSAQLEEEKKHYPLGRFGTPQDVAHAIVFLLSDASSWMTGTALKLDGGMTLS